MKIPVVLVGVVLLLASLAVSLRDREVTSVCDPPCTTIASADVRSGISNQVATVASVTAEPIRIEAATPSEYEARLAFHERVRGYFAHPQGVDVSERERYARELMEEVSTYEARGELSAPEAQLIKRELIRTSVTDDAAQQQQLEALTRSYALATERRMAQIEPDVAFEHYKVREDEIVTAVMQMQTIPDGLSRDEYLRQRLQSERERIYGDSR